MTFIPRRRTPLEERFWKYVRRGDAGECWNWTGYKQKGYGAIHTGGTEGRLVQASRASWWIHFGPITDGRFVCHHCDNRACVNPAHLFLGTNSDNMRDMRSKGRAPSNTWSRGERNGSAKLTAEVVATIRARFAGGGVTQKTLASEFGISKSSIHNIVRAKNWKPASGGEDSFFVAVGED